jgi:hypothetical protein
LALTRACMLGVKPKTCIKPILKAMKMARRSPVL